MTIYEADYDQIEAQVFNSASELYQFKPEFVIIFQSSQKLLKRFYKLNNREKKEFANTQIEKITDIYNNIISNHQCKLIYSNFMEINDSVFGNFSNKTEMSFIYQLRKLNYELMNISSKNTDLFINDLSILQNQYGNRKIFDSRLYINADMVCSHDFLPIIAKNIVDVIQSVKGTIKKCLILDLDNTLWGGIVGDDGMERIQIGDLGIGKAFTELQMWVKQLKERGIILAVCSKNNEIIAREPFEKHPDMVVRLVDISIFVANWDNKVDNIRYIQSVLNIGYDSMVFLDDNPFERSMVREYIKEITVPELPEDPAEYVNYLRTLNLFETASYTDDDVKRTSQYHSEAKRRIAQKTFACEDDFLASLEMISVVKAFDKFDIPRIAQLTQRSNQFNLRTIRYTEEEIKTITLSDDYISLSFTLQDKLGDSGLISIVILNKQGESLFIDTWIMSCRVLKRGMEAFVLNSIVKAGRKKGFKKLTGEYIITAKNELVKDHYKDLGFYL